MRSRGGSRSSSDALRSIGRVVSNLAWFYDVIHSSPQFVDVVQNVKKCQPLTLETVLGSSLPSILEQLPSQIDWQRQCRLDVTDDIIDRVVGSEGIATREAVGAVPNAVGADDDRAECHPL